MWTWCGLIQDVVRKQWEMWTPLKRSEYFCEMEFLPELFPHFTGLLSPEIHVIKCMHLLSCNECHKISSYKSEHNDKPHYNIINLIL